MCRAWHVLTLSGLANAEWWLQGTKRVSSYSSSRTGTQGDHTVVGMDSVLVGAFYFPAPWQWAGLLPSSVGEPGNCHSLSRSPNLPAGLLLCIPSYALAQAPLLLSWTDSYPLGCSTQQLGAPTHFSWVLSLTPDPTPRWLFPLVWHRLRSLTWGICLCCPTLPPLHFFISLAAFNSANHGSPAHSCL